MPALGKGRLKMQGQLVASFLLRSPSTKVEKNRNAGTLFSTCPVGGAMCPTVTRWFQAKECICSGDVYLTRLQTCCSKRGLRVAVVSAGHLQGRPLFMAPPTRRCLWSPEIIVLGLPSGSIRVSFESDDVIAATQRVDFRSNPDRPGVPACCLWYAPAFSGSVA